MLIQTKEGMEFMDNKSEVNILELLEYLQDTVEVAPKVPITGKVMIDKEEFDEVIEQIINYLPNEIKRAQWVMSEKDRLLDDAQREYENIKKETMDMMKQNVENHDVVREAKARAQEIISLAQRDAKAIRLGSREYSDEILSQLDRELETKKAEIITLLQNSFEKVATDIDSSLSNSCSIIKENIAELRGM